MEQPASPKVLRAAGMRWDEDGMMAQGGEMEGGGAEDSGEGGFRRYSISVKAHSGCENTAYCLRGPLDTLIRHTLLPRPLLPT